MNNRILSFEEIQNLIKPIAEENDLESVYLFGSYGRGDAGKDSDIVMKKLNELLGNK